MAASAVLGVALATLLASSAIQKPAAAAATDLATAATAEPAVSAGPIVTLAMLPDLKSAGLIIARKREVETVASIVSRRYRVSLEATRTLVDAAYRASSQSGIDPLLVIAVIAVESRFNPIAQSDGGAMGLMQIIPHYHADKLDAGAGSVLDPETNIQLGVSVLRDYIRRGGTEIVGLQLYNGSLDDVANSYATRVLAEKQRLQEALRRERGRDRA